MGRKIATTAMAKNTPNDFIEEVTSYLNEKGCTVAEVIPLYELSQQSSEMRQLELLWDGQEQPEGVSILVLPLYDNHRNMNVHKIVVFYNHQLSHFAKKALEFLP